MTCRNLVNDPPNCYLIHLWWKNWTIKLFLELLKRSRVGVCHKGPSHWNTQICNISNIFTKRTLGLPNQYRLNVLVIHWVVKYQLHLQIVLYFYQINTDQMVELVQRNFSIYVNRYPRSYSTNLIWILAHNEIPCF